MRRSEANVAAELTAPEHRHQLVYEVDEDWQLIAVWCDLHPTQEERP